MNQNRKPKDRDFLRTREGMFFCVTGYLHPPNLITAYLKYSPDPAGKWRDAETAYGRQLPYYHVRNVMETIRHLVAHYPHYVRYCPVRDIRFSMVPHEHIARYYIPQDRLQQILAGPGDALEGDICALLEYLEAEAGIPSTVFGVTGSTLTRLHNPDFSDIDLLTYGQASSFRLRHWFKEGGAARIRRPGEERVSHWCKRIARRFSLSLEEAAHLAQRRWNYGYIGDRYLSIHATRTDGEITQEYGDLVYRSQGGARIRAVLSDVSEGLFLPAIYRVEQVEVLDGTPAASNVGELVSYEGLFCDVAEAGEQVEACGNLETVNGEPTRLVIGTMQLGDAEYIKPVQFE